MKTWKFGQFKNYPPQISNEHLIIKSKQRETLRIQTIEILINSTKHITSNIDEPARNLGNSNKHKQQSKFLSWIQTKTQKIRTKWTYINMTLLSWPWVTHLPSRNVQPDQTQTRNHNSKRQLQIRQTISSILYQKPVIIIQNSINRQKNQSKNNEKTKLIESVAEKPIYVYDYV